MPSYAHPNPAIRQRAKIWGAHVHGRNWLKEQDIEALLESAAIADHIRRGLPAAHIKRQMPLDGLRADLVAFDPDPDRPSYLWEIKMRLMTGDLTRAIGQAVIYAAMLEAAHPGHEFYPVVAGLNNDAVSRLPTRPAGRLLGLPVRRMDIGQGGSVDIVAMEMGHIEGLFTAWLGANGVEVVQ